MKRTDAREYAFKTIYSRLFISDSSLSVDEFEPDDFYTTIMTNYDEHISEIRDKISNCLKGYTIDRLNKIDLSIIILAIIELDYIKENPNQVVINEAVELAKKYSSDRSPKFVNGFLAGLVK